MLVLCITPGLAGCFWGSSSFQVPTPEVTLHKESMLLSWDWVKNSKRFDVYCNDELVESISSNISKSYYFYDFSTLIDETGDYEFNVVAISNSYANDDSDKSESVTFSCTSVPQICIPESIIVPEMEEDQNKIVGVAINGTRVDVALLKNFTVDEYELYLYSQSTGLHVYPIDVEANRNSETNYSISLQLQNPIYNLQDEIYAVRIGYEKDGERKLCSNIRYVNPDGYPFYCDDIYMFDGYINDMYLESIQELRNLVYYTFVNRDTEVSVKISKPLQQVINVYAGLNGTDFKSKLLEAIDEINNEAINKNYSSLTMDAMIAFLGTERNLSHKVDSLSRIKEKLGDGIDEK